MGASLRFFGCNKSNRFTDVCRQGGFGGQYYLFQTMMIALMLVSVLCLVVGILLGAAGTVTMLRRQYCVEAQYRWRVLSEKARAARLYYTKRAARCRKGMSPDRSRDISRSSSASSGIRNRAVANHDGRLRAWKSFSDVNLSSRML
jgi:hypothetical protein